MGHSRNAGGPQHEVEPMFRKFMRCVAAALCCLQAVSMAASDDPKELGAHLQGSEAIQ